MSRRYARMATVGVAALAVLTFGAPAFGHTQATIDNPRAGATNVLLALDAEAESDTAGIKSLTVTLPDGVTPAQVSLSSAPGGWTFARTDTGFTVSGTPLALHTNAKATVRIAQLPATPSVLAFRTLVTYGDGTVQRWIEVPSTAAPSPPDPAPTVSLAAATGSPPPTVSPNAAVHNVTAPAGSHTPAGSALPWVIIGAVVVVLLAIGALLWRRFTRLHPND